MGETPSQMFNGYCVQDPGYKWVFEASPLVVLCNYINQTVTKATTIGYVCVKTVPQYRPAHTDHQNACSNQSLRVRVSCLSPYQATPTICCAEMLAHCFTVHELGGTGVLLLHITTTEKVSKTNL